MYTYPHTHLQDTNPMHIFTTQPPHTRAHTTMCTQDGFFPLLVASQEGHNRIVDLLLQAGATVDLQNKVDYYYLFICHLWCAMCGNHCTLSTTQHSGEYEGHGTYPTQPLVIYNLQGTNSFVHWKHVHLVV